ncbi:hypothetical protein V1514DRAFT_344383 [Lipomyces japonicus]|uniref:uncharacterized protein n=1 Tax=Lipomyces japonicus TaxID=56871 RepID=UPI0034CE52A6
MSTLADLPPITAALLAITVSLIVLPYLRRRYPDLHPFALHHQSSVSPVRNPDESAVHRSVLTPFTYPLVSGLNIRDGHSFRDGDLRDIWHLAKQARLGYFSKSKAKIIYHDVESELSPMVHSVAARFNQYVPGVKRVGIYLPNSIENVITSFACAHYDIATVLLPLLDDMGELERHIDASQPEILVFEAGVIDFTTLALPLSVKALVIVVNAPQSHLDWTEQLQNTMGHRIAIVTWHNLVSSFPSGESTPSSTGDALGDGSYTGTAIISTYLTASGQVELANFSHRNIVSAVAAQLRVIPQAQQWKPADIIVPAESLHHLYSRILFLAALTAGSTVIFAGVSGEGYDREAIKFINPTILISTAGALVDIVNHKLSLFERLKLQRASGILGSGNLPSPVLRIFPSLRILYTHEEQPPGVSTTSRSIHIEDSHYTSLHSADLSKLRALLGTHVVYALTHARVAGAICQTHVYDYRNEGSVRTFGPVVPAIEAIVRDAEDFKGGDRQGQLIIRGLPTADKGWVSTGIIGQWDSDGIFREI